MGLRLMERLSGGWKEDKVAGGGRGRGGEKKIYKERGFAWMMGKEGKEYK